MSQLHQRREDEEICRAADREEQKSRREEERYEEHAPMDRKDRNQDKIMEILLLVIPLSASELGSTSGFDNKSS